MDISEGAEPWGNLIMTSVHPFEEAGLGTAPFSFIEVSRHSGGACDYCATKILHRFVCESADQKRFVVGSDCIKKVLDVGGHDPELAYAAERAMREAERAEWQECHAAAVAAVRERPALFTDRPHPFKQRPATLRTEVLYGLSRWAQGPQRKAIVAVERELAAIGEPVAHRVTVASAEREELLAA